MLPSPDKLVELRLWWACSRALYFTPGPLLQVQALRWLGWLPKPCHRRCMGGFTLAELLISLAILGVIATFTIPKVLNSQQSSRNNAIAKEAMGTIEAAYQQHKLNGQLSSNTTGADLTQYINYVLVSTGINIDDRPGGGGNIGCIGGAWPCLKLHNGAILQPMGDSFGGTSTTNYIPFTLDPDGIYTGAEDSLRIVLYYNGKITSRNNCQTGSVSSVGLCGPMTGGDPAWFSW
jgi:prepilin-type N-terminal cleavage/methylation domain-containing protein